MTFRNSLPAVALAVMLGLGGTASANAHGAGMAQPYSPGWHHGWHMDPGQMGPGGMTPHMMSPGMMSPGMMMQGCPMGGGPGVMNQGMMGPGMMGPGMMGPDMMGPGMMNQGMMNQGMMMPQGRPSMVGPRGTGPGMMNPGMMDQAPMNQGMMMQPEAATVTVEDVSRMLEHRLAWQGNPHVKLGKVEAQDDDTIIAEIVTQDDSLVQRLEIDRRNGWMRMVP